MELMKHAAESDGLFIGLLSGTSADGVDCALVDLAGTRPVLMAFRITPYPHALRTRVLDLAKGRYDGADAIDRLGSLDAELGEFFADVTCELLASEGLSPSRIRAIGSHGQTIRHEPHQTPRPFTLQIGDPNRIAARTGIVTVADFRRMDLAQGGEGAPLVPGFLHHFFRAEQERLVFLNIGGIANVTLWPSGRADPIGFDTGPGNTLIDAWIEEQAGCAYDRDGFYSGQGTCIPELLERLLEDPYFGRPPPKSTGPEYFSPDWLHSRLRSGSAYRPADIARTLVALTAASAAQAIWAHAPASERVAVSGGGVKNPHIMAELQSRLAAQTVIGTDRLGLDPDGLEAMAFAWLAQQRLLEAAGNLPSVTGAQSRGCLGALYLPKPRD
ncbi:anhydro-N-acetylmuramic acid kinase [mine drainage metagenome]|uniref:Anhydro-N-acetylmuramic acid kinase n=3 Tax=mine drainage metagenome TaxID=410659 RepID=T0ZKC0_9ZZZZ